MSKYTPGPWIASATSRHYWYIDGPSGIVATISQENAEGNARLISAAPELLAALKDATAALHRYAGPETPLYEITQAKAAILKAESQ